MNMAAEYEMPICTTTPFPYCPDKPSFKLGVADVMGQVPTKPCPPKTPKFEQMSSPFQET